MGASLSMTITESSVNQASNTSVVTVKLYIKATGETWNGYSRSGYITIDGTKYNFSHSFSKGKTTLLATKSKAITHNADGSKSISVKGYYSTGVSPGNLSKTSSKTLTKISRQWTVAYNANGGSGAPAQQTKSYGSTLTLSSTRPTRAGYTFAGWATSATGAVAYQPGGSYTANAAVTLYAKWTPLTYTITLNANGGSGGPGSTTKTHGVAINLPTTKPTRTNWVFRGWAKSSTGTVVYAPGDKYTEEGNATLYAIWANTYTPPDITNVKTYRCDSTGTEKLSGDYLIIQFSWTAGLDGSGYKLSTKVAVTADGTSRLNTTYTVASGVVTIGPIAVSFGKRATATITVTDTASSKSTTKSISLPTGGLPFHIADNERTITLFGLPDESIDGLVINGNLYLLGGYINDAALMKTATINAWKTKLGISTGTEVEDLLDRILAYIVNHI